MMKTSILAILLVSISAAVASAIDFPTPRHKALDKLVGAWDVTVTYQTEAGEQTSKAACDANWILSAHFLKMDYDGFLDKRKFQAVQHLGFDSAKRRYVEIKMDSMDTGIVQLLGDLADDGKSITFTGERNAPGNGPVMKIRTVYTFENYSKFTIDWYMNGPDGKERKVVTMVHSRKS